jgi:RNA polymerase sigma factor (sigma-70 family)
MDEARTIQLAQKGDLAAFNRLVLAYQNLAYNVAYRIMNDSEAAADACQEAFISAFKGIGKLRGTSFKSWLLRIVTNACYDQLRYQRRRPSASLEQITGEDVGDDTDHSRWLVDDQAGPEELTIGRELHALIQQGIACLPADQRVVVVLSDVHGLSYQEIAEVTGVSLGTVKSRLSRARARLRDYLRAHPELLPTEYRLI